jgi:uncharacterized protein YutE (UPF0331/DUF86 family)
MQSTNTFSEESRLYDIAELYKERGYKVTVSPRPNRLPKFLSKFKPDIVAEGPNESVVVEVKSSNKVRDTNYWRELTAIVQRHPGWRLELVVNNSSKAQNLETINQKLINERFQEGQQLSKQGMLAASLLIIWSALEAAMRIASKKNEVDLPDLRPATVITRLYSDGLLEREEYDFLLDCMRLRNSVAHGFYEGRIKKSLLTRLQQISLRLMQ